VVAENAQHPANQLARLPALLATKFAKNNNECLQHLCSLPAQGAIFL